MRLANLREEFLNFVDNNYPEIVESIKETKDLTEENRTEDNRSILEEFKKSI